MKPIKILSSSKEMPSVITNAKSLEHRFLPFAKKSNLDRIKQVLETYKSKKNVNFLSVQNLVMALSSPSIFGKNGEEKVDKLFDTFISKYAESDSFTEKKWRSLQKMKDKADRVVGRKRPFQLKVGLYAQAKKLNPEPSDEQQKEREVEVPLRTSSSRVRKNKDLIQIWGGDLKVEAIDERIIDDSKWKMIMRGTAEFKAIYPIMMTSEDFAARERNFPGYIDAIYIAAWKPLKRLADVVPLDPKSARHQDAAKVGINFKYCHYRLDTTKPTFKDALAISSYRRNECWLNAIEERYRDSLMRPGKTKNIVNRATILKLINRTESSIKKGLTIEETLPFFERYKLKLRVYDVFYQLIFKYDPDVENRTNPDMFCVCDGNHIYLINKDDRWF